MSLSKLSHAKDGFGDSLDGIGNWKDPKNKAFVIESIKCHNLPKVGVLLTKRKPSPYVIFDGFQHNTRLSFKTKYIKGKTDCDFPEAFHLPFRLPNVPLKFEVTIHHQFFKIIKGVDTMDYILGKISVDLSEFSNRIDTIQVVEYPFDRKNRSKKNGAISFSVKFINFRNISDLISTPDNIRQRFQPLPRRIKPPNQRDQNQIFEEEEEEERAGSSSLSSSSIELTPNRKKYTFSKLQNFCDTEGSLEVFIPMRYREDVILEDINLGQGQRLHFFLQEHNVFIPSVSILCQKIDDDNNNNIVNSYVAKEVKQQRKKHDSTTIVTKILYVFEGLRSGITGSGIIQVKVTNKALEVHDSGSTSFNIRII